MLFMSETNDATKHAGEESPQHGVEGSWKLGPIETSYMKGLSLKLLDHAVMITPVYVNVFAKQNH